MRVCYDAKKDKRMPVLGDAEKEVLKGIAHKFQCEDIGLVEDLYLMLKSRGRALMSRQRSKKMVDRLVAKQWAWSDAFRKVTRYYGFFERLKALPYFAKLCEAKDTYDAVDRLLAIFRKISQKTQAAHCAACPNLAQCQFGSTCQKQADYSLPSHKNCAAPPGDNLLAHGTRALAVLHVILDKYMSQAALAMSRTVDGPLSALVKNLGGQTDTFDTTFTGEMYMQALEQLIDTLTDQNLAVFELARVFNETLASEGTQNKRMVEHVANDQAPKPMLTMDQVAHAYPEELADDDCMDKRMSTGELQVRQNFEMQKNKQYFETLLDVSGSMRHQIEPNKYGLISRANLASALCLSVLKKVSDEKGTLLFRFFAGRADRLKIANDADAFADLARQIGISNYNGGSTDIMDALVNAIADIKRVSQDGKGKAEILLITDAESIMSKPERLDSLLQESIHLHVIDVNTQGSKGRGTDVLKKYAKTYYHVDANNLDFKNIAVNAAD